MKKPVLIFISFLTTGLLFADIMADKNLNFSLDIPEGFNIVQADENNYSYHFKHPQIPVQFILKVQEKNNSSAFDVLETSMNKLKAKSSYDQVQWEGILCSISSFDMTLDSEYKGWSVCAPLEKENAFITLIAYSTKETFDRCQQFIISILNSLTISDKTSENPGIFLAYAFPKEGKKSVSINAGGKKFNTTIDKTDEEASQFLVDLEFGVLKLYANNPLWKEAWQRYYRLVFRDNYGRLSIPAIDFYKTIYPEAKKKRPEDPDTEYVSKLLSWVQTFKYERNQTNAASDLTPPVMALCGEGNDCDSRSLLMCCLLQHVGIDSILLISREYSHALCAFAVNGLGQTFETDHGNYLMCETTAPVTPGMIAQDHTDRSKWIVVD